MDGRLAALAALLVVVAAVVGVEGAEPTPVAGRETGWWRNAVFYQIFPRSYRDSNGDGYGDLEGVKQKLDYLKDLGVKAIILTPIYRSPMEDVGHDVSDFEDVDADYGGLDALKQLITEAHTKNIKVVLDFVPNHTSNKHRWFIDSQEAKKNKHSDYYIWKETDKSVPNNWMSVYHRKAWEKQADPSKKWYLHQFAVESPDLNFVNLEVQKDIRTSLEYWLEKGVDGFRINAINYLHEKSYADEKTKTSGGNINEYDDLIHTESKDDPRNYELLKSWREVLDNYSRLHNQSEKVLMTEAYTSQENVVKYFKYGSNIPFNFDLIKNISSNSKSKDFKNVIDDWIAQSKNYTPNWVLGNHDQSRVATRFPERSDQMTMLAMILPGIVVTYYGEEIGMVDRDFSFAETKDKQAKKDEGKYKKVSRDPFRTPFQWDETANSGFTSNGSNVWLPVHSDYTNLNLKKQQSDAKSHFSIYTNLVKLKNTNIVANGTTKTELLNNEDVLAVVRQVDEESVILLINFSNDKQQNVTLEKYAPGAKTATVYVASSQYKGDWNKTVEIKNVQLPAKASIVLQAKSGSGFLMASINLVLATSLLILFRIN